jgi:hypothetical protein
MTTTTAATAPTPGQSTSAHVPRRKRRAGLWTRRMPLALAIGLVALGVAGAVYQTIAATADARRYPPPGQLVDVGGY